MRFSWYQFRNSPSPVRYPKGKEPTLFLWYAAWVSGQHPKFNAIEVAIHGTKDQFVVGARDVDEEASFEPRFFPTLEAAQVYIELKAD